VSRESGRPKRNRIVVEAQSRNARSPRPVNRQNGRGAHEGLMAASLIGAAALATFGALFLTSRPYNPMDASVAPQQVVPPGPNISPSPKASPTPTATPRPDQTPEPAEAAGETAPDDATIQSQIEQTLAGNAVLSKLDVSTLVESGKVTIVGSVKSAELKQQVEKAIRSVKGVTSVDNQLVILAATP
jgi:hypothetical protein